MNRSCTGGGHFCNDCLPEYAEKMREQGRCAHRVVKFYWIQGGIVGCAKEPTGHDGEYDPIKAKEEKAKAERAQAIDGEDEPRWILGVQDRVSRVRQKP